MAPQQECRGIHTVRNICGLSQPPRPTFIKQSSRLMMRLESGVIVITILEWKTPSINLRLMTKIYNVR